MTNTERMRSAGCFHIRNSGFFRVLSFDIRHLQRSQGVISSARRSAKAEVRGANPRESANSKPLCLQQLQGEFRKLVFVGASPPSSGNGVLESWSNGEVRCRR